MEIQEKANSYAIEKTNEFMVQSLAQAYKDGYQDGYKDCEKEIPADFGKDETEYVDLGLPSGTLWAKKYEQKEGNVLYLSYDEALKYQLPTEEQWKELLEKCRWEPHCSYNKCDCIGPNGNFITFYSKGYITSNVMKESNRIYFWMLAQNDQNDDVDRIAIYMIYGYNPTGPDYEDRRTCKIFAGYKLPIWLVQK